MPDYRITLARAAEREIARLPSPIQARVIRAIDLLAENPRPFGSIKLKGSVNAYRIRVADYRVIYEINDKQKFVDIAHVRHRREAYE
ncbi:MAG: type II toxin-antitoxin system RelE/ParE family toxin [candidate division KSB1 bacterium]|nr:type II toxin-antitoxin system RelE/ParE family toxin [candidate division KSB1 bacterium]